MQPLHAVSHAVRAFFSTPAGAAIGAQVRNALRLGAVSYDRVAFGHALFFLQAPPKLGVTGLDCPQLVEDVKGQLRGIVAAFHPMGGVGIPAKVQPKVDAAERCDFAVRNLADNEVIKHFAARARDLAQILMPVRLGVNQRQLQSVVEKLLSQPLRRYAAVVRRMHEGITGGAQHLFIHEVRLRFGRVKRHKVPVQVAAAPCGLQHGTDFLHAGELVGFLEPRHAKVAAGCFDGLDFHRVIQPSEEDNLPRFLALNLHGRYSTGELVAQAQLVNGELHLPKHGIAQGFRSLAQNQGIHVGMFQHNQRDNKACERGFQRTAPAFKHVLRMLMRQHILQQRVIVGGEQVLDVNITAHPDPLPLPRRPARWLSALPPSPFSLLPV